MDRICRSAFEGISNRQTIVDYLAVLEVFGIQYLAPRFKSRGNNQAIIDGILVAFGNLEGSLVRLDAKRRRLWTKDAQDTESAANLLPALL